MIGGIISVISAILFSCSVEATPVPVTMDLIPQVTDETQMTDLGEYKITAYCSCSKCCDSYGDDRPDGIVYGASGRELIAGYSIAVDPRVIPYGSLIVINGVTYRADDCGGAIKGNRIDVYFSSHDEALEFGVQYADVYIVKEE